MSKAIIAEIKAPCDDHEKIESILLSRNAEFKGEDHQIDHYFKINQGRLKLREGLIENTLISYHRPNDTGVKVSDVKYLRLQKDQVASMLEVLRHVHEPLVVVDKKRKIFFIDNVKFHLDTVNGLGSFVEIEAIGEEEEKLTFLHSQCTEYLNVFGIEVSSCIPESYSDLLMKQ